MTPAMAAKSDLVTPEPRPVINVTFPLFRKMRNFL
jgi:hypothetical protein